jgi:D-amino-acid dehydrogenase
VQEVHILGAGMIGISTAIWLQRAGFHVTVIDRVGPAGGASYGNAGVLAAGSIIPITTPALPKNALGMLLDKTSPLFIRWPYLPKMIPFLANYLSHCTRNHVEHYARSMTPLLSDTVTQHRELASETDAESFVSEHPYAFGYHTLEAFDNDSKWWDLRAQLGIRFEILDGQDYGHIDPLFSDQFAKVVLCHDHGRIADPGEYIKTLASHFIKNGGQIRIEEISQLVKTENKMGYEIADQIVTPECLVVSTGAWSRDLVKTVGLQVPFETERGYHIELVNPSQEPVNSMMVASGKFVITPLKGRIRAAGIVEFGGLELPENDEPIELLKSQVQALLPGVTFEHIDSWLGHRPAPADSLPLIGQLPEVSNCWLGFGHQHVGLTGGAKTGRILSELIQGRFIDIDVTPFNPARFS